MEDIKCFLLRNDFDVDEVSLDSDDSDVSFDNKSNEEKQPAVSATKNRRKKGVQGQRLPTRRPDPNVYNRNALLARENRRKKKAHLEAIEKELEEARNINRSLLKALKKQHKIAQRLDREKQYFKNILANHTEINSLVNALNVRSSPYTAACISPGSSANSNNYRSSRSSSYETEVLSNNTFQNSENGSVTDQQTFKNTPLTTSSYFLDNFFTDFESTTTAYDETWNELLQENCFGFNPPQSPAKENAVPDEEVRIVNDDHSYVKDCDDTATIIPFKISQGADNSTKTTSLDNSGICLHIAGGKVSLEFCPSCHWNASRTPPTQLLQDVNETIQQSV